MRTKSHFFALGLLVLFTGCASTGANDPAEVNLPAS